MAVSRVFTSTNKVSTKFLASVFGYLFFGLAITAATAFAFAFSVVKNPALYDGVSFTDAGLIVLLGVGIGSFVAAWIDSLVVSIASARSGRAPWVGFLLYAVFLGFGTSLVLLAGIDFYTLGEAFGLTAVAFGIMFLIGYFSPVDLKPLAFVAMALLVGLSLVGLVFFVSYLLLVGSGAWMANQTLYWYDLGVSLVVLVASILITGYDANRLGKIANSGLNNRNLALFCAFSLYCDFINIFTHILFLLVLRRERR